MISTPPGCCNLFDPFQQLSTRSSWPDCLTELIGFSQAFTAENQPDCLLSLRDVKRCVKLIEWFRVRRVGMGNFSEICRVRYW